MAVMLEMEMPKYCLEAIGENYRVVKICPIRELCIRKWRSYIGVLNVHSDACPLVELSSQDNSWYTETPTEEGCFYVLQCKGKNHPEPYYGVIVNGKFSAISYTGELMPLPPNLIAWRKIEPYKA